MKKTRILFALTVLFCLISNIGAQITIQPKTKTFKKDVFDTVMTRAKEGMEANDRLVWTEATSDGWMKTNFSKSAVAWSNGIAGGNRTVLLQLPDNYYLILFTTSPELSVSNLFNTGMFAFKEGMKHNF